MRLKRKAVSPIIGTILMIGLTVMAGAMVFIVVLPMISSLDDVSVGKIEVDYHSDGNYVTVINKNNVVITLESIKIDNKIYVISEDIFSFEIYTFYLEDVPKRSVGLDFGSDGIITIEI